MYYSEIKNYDIANGEGVRVSLFVSGCRNHCENCFQPETWDFSHGKEFTQETIDEIIAMLDKSYINGLTILGGEPLEPENQPAVLELIKRVRGAFEDKDIWVFTGFTLEELREDSCRAKAEQTEEILSLIDVLVDGRYVDALRDLTLKFRGSQNQRLIDTKKTLSEGRVVQL